jgi:hypothetical protein
LKNPQLKAFCQRYQGESLSQIHKSFVNTDKISLILHKQHMTTYPHGERIADVRHRYVLEKNQPNQVRLMHSKCISNILTIHYYYSISTISMTTLRTWW